MVKRKKPIIRNKRLLDEKGWNRAERNTRVKGDMNIQRPAVALKDVHGGWKKVSYLHMLLAKLGEPSSNIAPKGGVEVSMRQIVQ